MLDDSIRYQLLSILERKPDMSQRELARAIGMSLGKTNYCLKALIEKGWIKIVSFRNSHHKRAYLYKLTPSGVCEKSRVTRRFLAIKVAEYESLARQIDQLRREVMMQRDSRGGAEAVE